jgi:glucokinase
MMDAILTADIGGSHITSSLVDGRQRKVVRGSMQRKRVNARGTADQIIFDWCTTLRAASDSQIQRIAIAMPGPFDYEKGICYLKGNNKYEALYGMNVKGILSERLGVPENAIRLMNDAASFLQGEMVSYTAAQKSIGLTLGTGIGSAIYSNGVAIDADLWKSPFKDGIAEEYLSTSWFVKRFKELTGETIGDVKELCEQSDIPKVQTIFNEFAENLAEFLMPLIARENPDVVILGGNIMKASSLFLGALKSNLRPYTNVPIFPAVLGEEAAMIGAAHAWSL